MDYIAHRLNAQDSQRVGQHLQECSACNSLYNALSAADTFLKQTSYTSPPPVYYSTILPRVRLRLVSHKHSLWDYRDGFAKIFLPLAVSILLVVVLTRIHVDSYSESAQTEALHQAVIDLNEDEIVQAVEREYTGFSLSPSVEVAAAGVAEHLRGDLFLKSAISKQIENEEMTDIDLEEIILDLDKEQVNQVLYGLSERNLL
jgi:hypothetical protein